MRFCNIYWTCFLFLLTGSSQHELQGQLDLNSIYDRLTSYDGISSNFVNYTLQDNQGYIWIATSSGLDRIDGKNIKHFKSNPKDSTSLVYNNTLSLHQADDNRLWVATRNGLCVKNMDDTFVQYKHSPDNPRSIPHNNVSAFLIDSKNRIWIGTQGGLALYNKKTNDFDVYTYDETDPNSLCRYSVESIFEDSKGNIWVSTWAGGISIVDMSSEGNIKFRRLNSGAKNTIGSGCFFDFFEDQLGRIWTHPYDGNLVEIRFPIKEGILNCKDQSIEFVYHKLFPDDINFQIHSFGFIKDDFLILSTSRGLKIIDHEIFSKKKLPALNTVCYDPKFDLDIERGHYITKDQNGIIWFSTTSGLFKLLHNLEGATNKNLESFCLKNSFSIQAIHVDRQNRIWLGGDKGLVVFDSEFNLIEKVILDKYSKSNGSVFAISQNEEGTLWIGTYDGIIYSIDNYPSYNIKKYKPKFLSNNNKRNIIWDIKQLKDNLWVSTHQGLLVYNPKTGEEKTLLSKDNPALSGGNVFDIVVDKKGDAWASFTGGGLTKVFIDTDGNLGFDQKSKGLLNNIIKDIELVDDNIWIASITGVQRYNITEDSFYYNELLHSSITSDILSIVGDKNDNIWFSSSSGLHYYDSGSHRLSNFNAFDGIVSELLVKSSYCDDSGNIYFGGTDGINRFQPEELLPKDSLDRIIFTNLTIANESVLVNQRDEYLGAPILTSNIEQTEKLTLTQNHKNIRIDFAIPDYLNPYRYNFQYKITNLIDEWVELNNENAIAITSLKPGNYELSIKANDSKGTIYKNKNLKINVLPYFWQQWWFIAQCIICFLLLTYFYFRYREKRIAAYNKQLESVVKERTHELKTKNEKLQNYIQSNMKLEQFAHAASHDLKSPMRTISSYIGLLKKKLVGRLNPREGDYLDHIENSAKRLHDLVDDMLSYSKINSDKLVKKNKDPRVIIDQVIKQLDAVIKEKNVQIDVNHLIPEIYCDELKVSRVIQNILANAIKFVPETRHPHIEITTEDSDRHAIFVIKDNGIGIPEEQKEKVFEIFKRVAHSSSFDGTGMGLAICKKIIESHGGKIWIESKVGVGSSFHFTLPKQSDNNISQ